MIVKNMVIFELWKNQKFHDGDVITTGVSSEGFHGDDHLILWDSNELFVENDIGIQ